jgi:outer membrane receptor protein involved in Fe transport
VHSDLELFSNFTYRLDDPANGDQIRQRDRGRWMVGAGARHVQPLTPMHALTLGMQTRYDIADVALYRSLGRVPRETVRADDVTQWSAGPFLELESRWTPRLRTVLGLRGDYFAFDVDSDRSANTGTASDAIVSPKVSVAFEAGPSTELYMSAGMGFHSNDARGTTQRIDPSSGEAVDPVDPLVPARGAELGLRTSALPGLRSTLALWTVELDSELLFVGDAGTTEASDGSRRFGITLANFWRLTPRLSADLDLSFTRARFLDVAEDEDRVPGALENVVGAGLSWDPEGDGLLGAVRLRHLGAYPLIEDNSVSAESTSIINFAGGYRRGPVQLTISLLNLFDAADADIQYLYASRTAAEPPGGVEGVHFHPIESRQLRISLAWGF